MESNTKQLTSLPKYWYVQRNNNNAKVLNEWNNKKYNSEGSSEDWAGSGAAMLSDQPYRNVFAVNKNKYTEITFEQFEKWVLNKNKNYELW